MNMKIAHICTATSWRGGEQQALNLAVGLRGKEIDTFVIAQPGSPMSEKAGVAGLEVVEIACRGEWDLPAVWRIGSALKRRKADLVHAHDGHAVTLAAFAGRIAHTKRLCTRRVDFALKGVWKYRWGMDRVICISQAIRNICKDGGVPEEKLKTVMSGIDLNRAKSGKEKRSKFAEEFCPDKKKPLLMLNIASLTDHKGQCYLLEAMPKILAKLPQTHLIIVGTGELESKLKKQAFGFALEDQVSFAGFREDIPDLLCSSDLFIMSSHLEGLCTSVMDAMTAGMPVVVTDAGGLPELVSHEKTGLVVPPKDPEALTDAILDLLTNRKKREHLGRAAAAWAVKHFGMEQMVDGTIEVYRELIGSKE